MAGNYCRLTKSGHGRTIKVVGIKGVVKQVGIWPGWSAWPMVFKFKRCLEGYF